MNLDNLTPEEQEKRRKNKEYEQALANQAKQEDEKIKTEFIAAEKVMAQIKK